MPVDAYQSGDVVKCLCGVNRPLIVVIDTNYLKCFEFIFSWRGTLCFYFCELFSCFVYSALEHFLMSLDVSLAPWADFFMDNL